MSWGIPAPSGPYPVACHDILNKTGLESSMFRLYYPSTSFDENEETCPVWMDSEYLVGIAGFLGNGFGSKLFKWYFKSRRIPVLLNGPLKIPESTSKLPLVLVSHGLGLTKNLYSYMSYEIASHGFIVAAVDHRDGSACASLYMDPSGDPGAGLIKKILPFQGGKLGSNGSAQLARTQLQQRLDDMSKLMDCIEELNNGTLQNILLPDFDLTQFKDKIDIEKCSVMGHSFGGATTVASLATDDRFKVGLALDAWMIVLDDKYFKMKAEKPLIFINCIGELKKVDIVKMRLFDPEIAGGTVPTKMITILGTTHLTQTDFAFFPKTKMIAKLISRGSTDPQHANDLNTKIMLNFIGKHLDLPCRGEADDVVNQNERFLIHGSDIKVDEEEIQLAITQLSSGSQVE